MGRIHIRPPGNWASMTKEEKLAWARQLQAQVIAEAEAEGDNDQPEHAGPTAPRR